MSYEKLYIEMCRESGHREFHPTRAILDRADKELEANKKVIAEAVQHIKNLTVGYGDPKLMARSQAEDFVLLHKDSVRIRGR